MCDASSAGRVRIRSRSLAISEARFSFLSARVVERILWIEAAVADGEGAPRGLPAQREA